MPWLPSDLSNIAQWTAASGYASDLVGGKPVLQSNIYATSDLDPNPINVRVPCYTGNTATTGVNTYASYAGSFSLSYPFTMTGWSKTTVTSGRDTIFGISDGNSTAKFCVIYWSDGKLGLQIRNTTALATFSPSTYNDGNWKMVTAVFVNSATRYVYVGPDFIIDEANNGSANTVSTLNRIFVGALIRSSSPSDGLGGQAANCAIYNSELSSGEISELFYSGKIAAKTPAYFYPCQEGSGDTIYDCGPNGRHLSVTQVTGIWGHYSDATRDHCVEHGGTIEGGAFIPSLLDNSLAANGSGITITNKISPLALVDRDFLGTLPTVCASSPYSATTDVMITDTVNSKFEIRGDYNERSELFTASGELTGSNLNSAKNYIGLITFNPAWSINSNTLI